MENNFYVGVVYHGRRLVKPEYREKLVLYSDDNINYVDLVNNVYYTSDKDSRDYVEKETLISTNIREYRDDYLYLLNKYKNNSVVKKRINRKFFN